ncbi:MAG: TonB-dependent receptor [bacterium]
MKNILIFFTSVFLFTVTSFASGDFFRIYNRADITDYGQPSFPRYLSLLGLSNRHTLITLDGRKINSFQDGNANLNHIPIRLIENIEIQKGINSVLDGPNVLGGAVNILTSEPDSEIPYTCLYSIWGTSGLENYGLNFKNQNGSLRYSVFAEKIFSRGYGFYKESNRYNAVSLYAKMHWYYNPKTWFTITTSKYEDNVGAPKNKHLQLKYETHQSKTALKIRFYGDKAGSEQNNSTQGNEATIEQKVGKYHLIRVGRDHHWNKYANVSNKEDAFYYEDEINLNDLTFTIGQRHDKNSLFTKEKSPRFRLNYQLEDKTILFLSAGQGISFPYKDNPNLVTEKGRVYTLGFKKILSDFVSLNLTGYFADVENFLLCDMEDVTSVTSKGAETEILFAVNEKINIQTIYTYLLTEDKEIKKSLPCRPENKFKTNLSYKNKKHNGDLLWTIVLSHEYQGDRYANRENFIILKSFSTVNLSINMKLARAFTVNFSVNNLDNDEYSLVWGYPMPRRNFSGGIIWEFWD